MGKVNIEQTILAQKAPSTPKIRPAKDQVFTPGIINKFWKHYYQFGKHYLIKHMIKHLSQLK